MADGSFNAKSISPNEEWLAYVQPTGLVVAAKVLDDTVSRPLGQSAADTALVTDALETRDERARSVGPYIADPWGFVAQVLGWDSRFVAGAPKGPPLPADAEAVLSERGLTLRPDWVVTAKAGDPAREGWQLFVRLLGPEIDLDRRGTVEGWDATASQQMERLLREAGAPAGLILGGVAREREHARPRPVLRLITAPKGETSGWMDFPVQGLAEVAGRPLLGGLKLLLGDAALYKGASEHRLPALINASREAQANVSKDLADQVLGALHALLRGLTAAAPHQIGELAKSDPHHLYEGLLTVLMRLVFLLYAEDRDLLPAQRSGPGLELYEANYSVRGLLAKLEEDEARYPATMDDRVGGWGRLLALFRLVSQGDPHGWIQARGGKLFDPDAFPFLESRHGPGGDGKVGRVSDACVLQVLRGLMRLKGERLSYRTLDVEQIGSVYETVMGFTVETADGPSLAIKGGKRDRTPVFVNLATLAAVKPGERLKWLKKNTERGKFPPTIEAAIKEAVTTDDLAAAFETSPRGGVVDDRASPGKRIVPAGTPLLQPTDERRRTGSHYTPRSLTEPIVRHALEPAFERLGPDANAEQILDLKVCDPAMGSGAFLVEACRQLGARLEQAWERWKESKPAIPADEDETLHARRLVAQKCLYGVDKNPMATDLARLSLWMATLARDHEFTFLDHALKSGDSLVGLTNKQIMSLSWSEGEANYDLIAVHVRERLREAERERQSIRAAPDYFNSSDLEPIHARAESKIAEIRLLGDAVVAAFFWGGMDKARKAALADVRLATNEATDWRELLRPLAAKLGQGFHPTRPFHWEVEFPEVFDRENGGFDAVVGNPPFLGVTSLGRENGFRYTEWLRETFGNSGGKCDVVAFFFRRAFQIVRKGGCFGLVATNTIGQGDTRESGLFAIRSAGGTIFRALRRLPWPGEAAVIVSIVHVYNGATRLASILDNTEVDNISSYLSAVIPDQKPKILRQKIHYIKGVVPYGEKFFVDSDDKVNEALNIYLRKTVGGRELNNLPDPNKTKRRLIFLEEFPSEDELKARNIFEVAKERLFAQRNGLPQVSGRDNLVRFWWRYYFSTEAAIARNRKVVVARVSPVFAWNYIDHDVLPNEQVVAVAAETYSSFATLQSRLHELWAWTFGSTMKSDLRYTPSDVFETFPFPDTSENPAVEASGNAYHERRAAMMIAADEGLTKTYNRFHDPDETRPAILELRRLHDSMDHAVLTAYEWADLIPRAVPIFEPLFAEDEDEAEGARRAKKRYRYRWPEEVRDEVLARLLALNGERAAAERSAIGKVSPTERAARRAKVTSWPAPGGHGVPEHGPLFEREDD